MFLQGELAQLMNLMDSDNSTQIGGYLAGRWCHFFKSIIKITIYQMKWNLCKSVFDKTICFTFVTCIKGWLCHLDK